VTQGIEWFGYKLHLVVDVHHEVALAYRVSSPSAGDNTVLPDVVADAQKNLPKHRIRTLAYDKAADDEKVHRLLHQAGIAPVIQQRALWKEELERVLPGQTGAARLVHDEAGTVYCCDTTSDPAVRRRMAYIGHEPKRQTLKYRCPARHGRWSGPSDGRCNAGKTYGRTQADHRPAAVSADPAGDQAV
jgi:hypothetical protein